MGNESTHGIARARQRLGLSPKMTNGEVASLIYFLIGKGDRIAPRQLRGLKVDSFRDTPAAYYKVSYKGKSFVVVMTRTNPSYVITVLSV